MSESPEVAPDRLRPADPGAGPLTRVEGNRSWWDRRVDRLIGLLGAGASRITGLLVATPAQADTAPPNPADPVTVSADALPTAQINGVVWNEHNYLRMLWGKKILEWTATPQDALAAMIELNNKYALDGRDPNSYSGIFWVLGRYDRPWAPRRPIFGVIRYMSSANTMRKLKLKRYLETYGRPRSDDASPYAIRHSLHAPVDGRR